MSAHAKIVHEAPSLQAVVDAVSHEGAGAVSTFLGTVRAQNEGRAVQLLEYEAYEPMAVREMNAIVDELAREYPGVRLAVEHRVGALRVGDVAVACAASAPHRTEAFLASRALIDRIKARVPIWKREHGPEGPYWVGWQDARCVPDDGHGGSHGHPAHHGHHGHASADEGASLAGLGVAIVTVSDTRTRETDTAGAAIEALLVRAGATVLAREIEPDEPERIRAQVSVLASLERVAAVVLTGGTGIAPRDRTLEAIAPLFERRLEGFGEAFRQRSWAQVGARAMLSRCDAGVVRGRLVFALPGSERAARLAVEELIVPLLPHAAALLRGETLHTREGA